MHSEASSFNFFFNKTLILAFEVSNVWLNLWIELFLDFRLLWYTILFYSMHYRTGTIVVFDLLNFNSSTIKRLRNLYRFITQWVFRNFTWIGCRPKKFTYIEKIHPHNCIEVCSKIVRCPKSEIWNRILTLEALGVGSGNEY